MMKLALLLLSGSASALQLGVTSRRALLQKVAGAAPLIVVAPAFAEQYQQGNMYPGKVSEADVQKAVRTSKTEGDVANSLALTPKPFVGTFEDPQHPGCKRVVARVGARDFLISGADEDGKPWRVYGTRAGARALTVDFTPKGGPSGVEAVQVPKTGDLKFPDGNVWKKVGENRV